MTLGDFSSVVQLGVGLHAGTALLQSVAEFSSSPMSKRLSRLATIAEVRAKHDKNLEDFDSACDLLSDLEVKKIQFFNEYREVASVNTGVAVLLCCVLAIIAFLFSEGIPAWVGCLIVFISFGPAAASLAFLWFRWKAHTQVLNDAVDALHSKMLGNNMLGRR